MPSLLQGGKKRRRGSKWAAALVILLAPLLAAAAAWVPLETLLNGMLLVSGNDAAIALAVHVSGSQRRFVHLMNRRAREWGLRCTHFSSPHGIENGNRSCAHDLAVMTRLAMSKRRIRRIVRRRQVAFHFPIKGGKLYLTGHNPLMAVGY